MGMFEDDFVLRAAKQLAQVLSRIMGLRQQGREEDAERELEGLYRGLVPFDPQLFELLDTRTLASMLTDAARLRVLCEVMMFDGDGAAERGRRERAQRTWRRALELLQYGLPEPTESDRELMDALRARAARGAEPEVADPRSVPSE